jgi:hypothetical protein
MLLRPVRDEASQGSAASVRVAEREGFLQTRCYSQSMTKLVRALKLQRKRRQGDRAAQLDSGALRLDNNSLF